MAETLNMLYRLFAPLLVVFLIIAGVDLSSNLIKNTQTKQTAISVAYAAGCVSGKPLQSPKNPKKPGQYLVMKCVEMTPAGPIDGFSDPATGCCHGQKWDSAKKIVGSSTGASQILGKLIDVLGKMIQKKPGTSTPANPQQDQLQPPICKTLSVSPTLPLRPGDSATLTWVLEGGPADASIVSPGVGAVQGFSARVTPRTSTTYTVTAKSQAGSSTCPKVRVHVGPSSNDETGDDGVFNSNTNTGSNNPVDVFNYADSGNGSTQSATRSAYDDVWRGGQDDVSVADTSSELPNEDDDYYDFLSSLAGSEDTSNNTDNSDAVANNDYGDYYYGDASSDFDLSALDQTVPDSYNFDLQDGIIGETDSNSLELDARADNYTEQIYAYEDSPIAQGLGNSSGLTDEEIYGVWNRPQSPATGGLGLSGGYSGGYGSGASNVPTVDLGGEPESASVLSKVGRWIKNTFCFWCSGPTGLLPVSGHTQTAAARSAFVQNALSLRPEDLKTNSNEGGQLAFSDLNTSDILLKLPKESQRKTFAWKTPDTRTIYLGIGLIAQAAKVRTSGGEVELITITVIKSKNLTKFNITRTVDTRTVDINTKTFNKDKAGIWVPVDADTVTETTVTCKSRSLTIVDTDYNKGLVTNNGGSFAKVNGEKGRGDKYGNEVNNITLDNNTITKPLLELGGYRLACGKFRSKRTLMQGKATAQKTTPPKKDDPKATTPTKPKTKPKCASFVKDGKATNCEDKNAKQPGKVGGKTTKPKATLNKCDIKKGEKLMKGLDGISRCYTPIDVRKVSARRLTPQQACARVGMVPGVLRGRKQCVPRGQQGRPIEEQRPKPPTPDEMCARKGEVVVSVRGRLVQCGPRPGSAASKRERDLAAQLKAAKAARVADNKRAQAAIKRQAAQSRAAQQRAAQQRRQAQKPRQQARPPQSQPQQRRPQPSSDGGLRKLLQDYIAKLQGNKPNFPNVVDKPQCLSFTSDKLKTSAGDEITLQWAVKGVTKIVITPKVRVVEISDGAGGKKQVAKANPESSVRYTLIATNEKGEEHRCQTKQIVVDGGTGALTCEGTIDNINITINPSRVTRPACDPEQDSQTCDTAWPGKLVKIGWEVNPKQCVTSCKISNQDGEIWTSSADLRHKIDGDKYGNEGNLRETSTFKIRCEDGFGNIKEDEARATVEQDSGAGA